MFESLLEKILQKLFGEYIDNLDQENLHVGVWSGNVRLENVFIKKNILRQMKLPFVLKFGKVRLLNIIVPWRKITNSPVEVMLDGLYLVFTPQSQSDWEVIDTISPRVKEEVLKAFTDEAMQKLEQKIKEGMVSDGKMTFWERIIAKVIDNIQVTIKDVHIRFEDPIFRKSPYAFGFSMKELLVVTTNENWKPEYIDRTDEANRDRPLHKHLKLCDFAFYWESENATMVSTLPSDLEVETGLKKIGAGISKRNYILKPLCLEVRFVQSGKANDYTKPRYAAKFAIEALIFKMHKDQFDNIVEISKVIEKYQKLQFSYEDTKKYKVYRPIYPVLVGRTRKLGTIKTIPCKNEVSVQWWKYAIECVKRIIREKRGKKGQFRISDIRLRMCTQEFMLLYAKIVNNKEHSEDEKLRYNKILNVFDSQQLKLWASKVLQEVEKKTVEMQAQAKAKQGNEGWFSYLFGSGGKAEDEKKAISEDEVQKLYAVLKESVDPAADAALVPEQSMARTDEYYWLVGEFSLAKGMVKIQRDKLKPDKGKFKEAIVLTVERINTRFQNRFKGLDLDARIGSTVLSTYSSFGKKNRISNVVMTRNLMGARTEEERAKKSAEDLGILKISVMPPNTDMQFEIEASAKSVRIYYLPLLMSRMMMFLGQEEVRSSTYNALNEIKDNTQVSIQAALEGKKSRISVSVESPVVLVPILKNNDPASPVWCFRLGDMSINTQADTKVLNDGPIYDKFNIKVDNLGMEMYNTLLGYEACEKGQELRPEEHFAMIKDFSVMVDIGVLRDRKKSPDVPTTKVDCVIKDIQFRFTPSLYNYFVNISEVFGSREEDEAWSELVRDKATVIKAMRMIGVVKKRGEGLKKYWYKYYCCLSGGYLYFYEANRQLYPTTYFYLKNAEVSDGLGEIGAENTLILRTHTDQCYLAFNTKDDWKNWKKELESVVQEISFLSDALYKKPPEPIDFTETVAESRIQINKLGVELLDEKCLELVHAEVLGVECTATKRTADFTIRSKILSLEVIHPKNAHFKRIVFSEEHCDLLRLCIEILEKNSPRNKARAQAGFPENPQGEQIIVELQLGNIVAYYPNRLIKRMIQILLDIKPKKRPKLPEEEKKGEVLKPLEAREDKGEEPIEKLENCRENKDIFLAVSVKLSDVKVHCLHPKSDTLLFLFSMESSKFEYISHVDHDNIHCNLGNSVMYDLTNYPNTIIPMDFFDEDKVKKQKVVVIEGSYDNDDAFVVDMVSYYPHCPERPTTPDNLMSKIQLKIGTIKVYYYNEYLAFRFMDYFLYQFLDSLSPRDSMAESLALYEKSKKSHEGLDLYSVFYCSPFCSVDISIAHPYIYLKPRLHYKDFFLIDLGNLHVWSERKSVVGRWLKHEKEPMLCEVYHMDTSSLNMNYNDRHTVLNPCKFNISFELVCIEAYDYCNHRPEVLDQSIHLKVAAPETLKLCMKPEHYTYLLKCLDLNINYTDGMSDMYNFRQVNVDALEGGIKYTLDCNLPIVSFLALNCDGTILAEFVSKDVKIGWTTYNDYSKDITVSIQYVYALHEKSSDEWKSIIIAPTLSRNQVPADESFYSLKIEKQLLQSNRISFLYKDIQKQVEVRLKISKTYAKDWKVTVEAHKMYLKLYFLMMLSHFFIEGFPSYTNSPEQPNEYNDDPEKYPRSKYQLVMKNTMMLIPSEDPTTSFAIRGEVEIELLMESIATIKDELMHNLEQPPAGDLSAGPDSLVTYSLAFKLNNMYPFMCNTTELDGRRLEQISKRKVMEPLTLEFSTKELMQLDRLTKAYKALGETSFKGDKVFLSTSYQDIMYLSKAFVYNMKTLEREYFSKLIYFNKLKSRGLEISDIAEEGKEDSGVLFLKRTPSRGMEEEKSRTEEKQDEMRFLGANLERSHSEYVPVIQGDDNIWQVVSEAMKSMEQLKKASKAMSQYKEKASMYAMKNTKMSVSQVKSTDSMKSKSSGKRVAMALLDERLLKTVNEDAAGPEMFERGSQNSGTFKEPSSGVAAYERVSDVKSITFESFKILLINDHKSVFCPILNINLIRPRYRARSKMARFRVQISSMYYNPVASFWEPFIEQSKFTLGFDETSLKFTCKHGLNINISDTLINVIAITWKSWNEKKPSSKHFQALSRKSARVSTSQLTSVGRFDNNEQGVCPFSVKNETGLTIYLAKAHETALRDGNEKLAIHSATTLDIRVNYAETIENLLKNPNNSVKLSNSAFEISFEATKNYPSITNVNFNTVESNIHYLAHDRKSLNYFVYSVTQDRMSKLLTIRTAFAFLNKSTHNLILEFYAGMSTREFAIRPGEFFAVPIEHMYSEFGLSYEGCEAKSARQTVESLIHVFQREASSCEVRIGNLYFVLRKEATSTERAFDIAVIPPYSFRNALPCGVRFQMQETNNGVMVPLGKEESMYEASSETPVTLTIMLQNFRHSTFTFDPAHFKEEHKVTCTDESNNPMKVYIRAIKDKTAKYSFYIYAGACILNRTECPLTYFYYSTISKQNVAGQTPDSTVLIIMPRPKIQVYFGPRTYSCPLSIRAAGITNYFTLRKREENGLQKLYEFVLTVALSLAVQDEYIYTKIITISPKYVFHNCAEMSLEVVQAGSYESPLCIEPGGSSPFHWPDSQRPKLVMLRLGLNPQRPSAGGIDIERGDFLEWDWSSPFSLEGLGTITVKCRHQTRGYNYIVLKINKGLSEGSITIEVQKERDEHPAYRIENYSRHFALMYWQKGKELDKDYLDVLSQVMLGWTDNNMPRVLQVKFLYGTLGQCPVDVAEKRVHEFTLDELDQRKEVRIRITKKTGHLLYVSTLTDGYTKILKITDVQSAYDMSSKEEKCKFKYLLQMKKVGLSIIIRREKQRSELAYITFDKIEGLLQSYETQLKLQLNVGELQLDNQLAFRVPYPVIMQSTALKKQREGTDYQPAFFQLMVAMRTNAQPVYYFEILECHIQTMDVKLDDEVLSFVIDFADYVTKEFQTTVSAMHEIFSGIDRTFLKYDNLDALNNLAEEDPRKRLFNSRVSRTSIKKAQEQPPESKIYIASLRISSIEIVLSFLKKMQSEGKLLSQAGIISKAIGVAITNVEASSLSLDSLELDHVFGTTNEVLSKIYGYYSEQLITTALKLIGSIDFIGNPIKFFYTIATGVKDFIYKPIQGFVHGPLQGSTGVYEGTKSLVKNTIIGTFGTISKITSSWSKGLLTLSNDEEYMSKREERFIKEKAETIVDGVGYGITSAFKSLQSGVVGIFKQPIIGAKKRGFKGFLKGAFFGLTGAVVKPVSGALDLIARTSEGGKNTATIFEQNAEVRVRNPRAFYMKYQIIQEYNKRDADIRTFLENVKKGKYLREHMLDESVFQADDDYYLLFITEQHIVYISIKEKCVIWQLSTPKLQEIEKLQNGLTLTATDGTRGVMLVPEADDVNRIYDKLNGIRQMRSYLTH